MAKRKTWSSTTYIGTTVEDQKINLTALFSKFHSVLLELGLTQTSDIGQLADFNNFTPTNVKKQTIGYKIYELNDIYHTNSPIFIKVLFEILNNTTFGRAHIPVFSIQIGSGSNGVGSLLKPSTVISTVDASDVASATASQVFPTIETPSFSYLGDGVLWLAMNCNGVNSATASNSIYPNNSSSAWSLASFIISRPCDASGDIVLGKAALIVNGQINTFSGSGVTQTKYNAPATFLNLETGACFNSLRTLARPLSDIQISIDGAAPISRVYGFFGGGGLFSLSGVGSIPSSQASDGGTTTIALHGITEKEYITPATGLKGFLEIPTVQDSRNQVNSPYFDTPILAWEV